MRYLLLLSFFCYGLNIQAQTELCVQPALQYELSSQYLKETR
ncbi:MAG: hypothetical protein AB8E82_04235 [Aureispira sp.]